MSSRVPKLSVNPNSGTLEREKKYAGVGESMVRDYEREVLDGTCG